MSFQTKGYFGVVSALGLGILALELSRWESQDMLRYVCFLVVAALASSLKLSLPAMTGAISVSFLFVLFGVVELSVSETMLIGAVATAIEFVRNLDGSRARYAALQLAFRVATMVLAIFGAFHLYHSELLKQLPVDSVFLLVIAATAFFALGTVPAAVAIALTEEKPFKQVWRECYSWSFPYYLAGTALAGLFSAANRYLTWPISLMAIPVAYLLYRSYCLYVAKLEDQKKHAEEMASLHLRTIEALALAIEAKDHTTRDHLQRVQVYALELGRMLKLTEEEIEALRAASLLHDIGKLAVPEHIISKPGRLTPEEFEKMKIHPVVGAELLERVQFPYPVAPIVRAHHEKWNGTGYPAGLSGEQIPIGARILAAVDCLDALASDRQYRRALPLDQAMAQVKKESGTSFDPRVVHALEKSYIELEQMALASQAETPKLSTNMKVTRGLEPGAGFESSGPPEVESPGGHSDFLHSIAAATQEVQALFELAQDLGNSLSLDETLSVLAVRLRRIIPYDAMAIYLRDGDKLRPEYVNGDDFRLFSSLEIPVGQGLSGWVAENRKPIINGNPSVEPGYLNDPAKFSTLRSALSVPLEGLQGNMGVFTLYHAGRDAFTKDHLRILLAISSKVALSIENALKYRQAESSATTDYLTGLPNARSLFLHLDGELARCRRLNIPLSVLVCDLDGFKLVNDRFGHLEGNKVLHAVALGMKEHCREFDYVARLGGDEFVMVLPGLKPEAVKTRSNELAAMTSEAGRAACNTDMLSMSIGEACFPDDGSDVEKLLAAADRRMYKAKQRRRGRASDLSRPAGADWRATIVQ